MKLTQRFNTSVLPLAIATLLTSGCDEKERITEPPGPSFAVSESEVLDDLITAYTSKDIDAYTELFDCKLFTFLLDPEEAQDPNNRLPLSWDCETEMEIATKMFASPNVLDIKLDFVEGPKLSAKEADLVPLHWTKVITTEIELEIDTVDPSGGENIIFKVSGDRSTFFFLSYPEETIGNDPRVRIVEWRDQHVG